MYRDLGSSMKICIPLLILIFSQGCSKSANPVKFSKIENQKKSRAVAKMSSVESPSRKLTLLEMYLEKKVTREYSNTFSSLRKCYSSNSEDKERSLYKV